MRLFLFVILFFNVVIAHSQVQEIWQKPLIADCIEVDKLGNIYAVHNNVISKYDEDLNFLCRYDNYSAGNILLVDVSNPFKVIVFYSEFNKLIYLDSNLAELKSPINLDDLGFYNITSLCSSSFGGFWLFDEQNVCTIRVDNDLRVIQQGTNLYSKIGLFDVLYMQESANYLLLFTAEPQLIVLDKFGNYFTTIEVLPESVSFCTDNDIVYCSSKTVLQVFDLSTETKTELATPYLTNIFCVKNKKIFAVTGGILVCSKIK